MKVSREDWKGEAKEKISKIYIKNVPTTVMEEVTIVQPVSKTRENTIMTKYCRLLQMEIRSVI
jgi:hypothetical protein